MNNDNKTLEEMAKEYVKQEQLEYEEGSGAYYGFLAGYKAAQDQLADADKVMPQWISVKDRLPEIDKYVLITHQTFQDYTNLKVMEACRISDEKYEIWGDHVILADYVDYWMPLPKPPEDE